MSIFRCTKCGCVENTALSNYWSDVYGYMNSESTPPLCSECDPKIGKWHDSFEKHSADGLLLGADGFLYSKQDRDRVTHTELLGEVKTPESKMPEPEEHGLMDKGHGFFGGSSFPMSRDWGLPDMPCKRVSCVCNNGSGVCFVPSRASIGEDGKCEGYHPNGCMKTDNEEPDGD